MYRTATLVIAGSTIWLGACTSSAPVAPVRDSEEGGIQSRAIRTAPMARQEHNESRPLSALNTPEAIAAREAAARRARATTTPPVADKSSTPGLSAFLAAAANRTPQTPAPSEAGIVQTGSKVRARNGAVLHARPSVGSSSAAINSGAELELGQQVNNAGGRWWYVVAGSDSGWLSQADIAP